jgi:predicted nucleic acid-binding protein
MRIAITDACIFIELHGLGLTERFFELPCEMHTTVDVINEVLEEQAAILHVFERQCKLSIYSIEETERQEILSLPFPKALSENDKTVIFIAGKLDAIVLSSDRAVRNYAKNLGIECHGILWILDKLVECGIICALDAATKIERLMIENLFYHNNLGLIAEMRKRITVWKK